MRVGNFSLTIPQGEEADAYIRLAHDTPYTLKLKSHYPGPADAVVTIDGRPIGEFRLDSQATVTVETPPNDPGRGRLTFYAAETEEGVAAGKGVESPSDRGLIQVVFKPGRVRYTAPVTPLLPRSPGRRDYNGPDWWKPYRPVTEPRWESGIPMNASCHKDDSPVTLCSTGTLRDASESYTARFFGDPVGSGPGPDAAAGVTGLSGTSSQTWVTAPEIDYIPDAEVTISVRLVAVPKAATVRPLPPAPVKANSVPPPV